MTHTWGYRATVTKVVDGDTVHLDVDLGFHLHMALKARLRYLDAPEGKETPAADYVHLYYPAGTEVWIETTKSDKYGRWLVEIWKMVDGQHEASSLNEKLLVSGLAAPYNP